jgi:hypothetical protein
MHVDSLWFGTGERACHVSNESGALAAQMTALAKFYVANMRALDGPATYGYKLHGKLRAELPVAAQWAGAVFRLTTTAHTCRHCRARGCVCVCAGACDGVRMEEEEGVCLVCSVCLVEQNMRIP